MTGRDKFPFGKYGPPPRGCGWTLQQVKDDPRGLSYIDWLRDQPWAEEKWADLLDWFDCGDSATSTIEERKVINAEVDLLKDAPSGFTVWWQRAYGERLRKSGEVLYVPYLRVALEAWRAALTPVNGQVTPEQIKVVTKSTPTPVLPTPTKPSDNRDEEVNF